MTVMHVNSDLVRETTTTTGTGTYTLAGAQSGYRAFSAAMSNADTCWYAARFGTDYEVGIGTYSASTLARTSIIISSNSNNAVNWAAGTKDIYMTTPPYALKATPAHGGNFNLIGGKLVLTVASNALTVAVKTVADIDPTPRDPVFVITRDVTAGSLPGFSVLPITAALSLTVSSGSTLGAANGVPFRLWFVIFNDAGTPRLGVINCRVGGGSPTKIAAINDDLIASSTAEGGAGAADNAAVFYSGTAVSSKAFRIVGYAEWSGGLATAGTWNSVSTSSRLFGAGTPTPGATIQTVYSATP